MARDVYKNDYYRIGVEGVKLPVRWLPPESLKDGVFTSKSDVWAFGVLLWEIQTMGKQPYPARSHLEVLEFVCDKGTLDKPASCPPVIRDLMDQCWSYLPNDRPSFLECLSTIQEFMLVRGTEDSAVPGAGELSENASVSKCFFNNHPK